jgi:transcriptional regulator with XRE-family HTH domain
MKNFRQRLGENLKLIRGEATLRDFAPKVGLDARSLHRIENGEQNVTLDTLSKIAEGLNFTAGDLLDEKSPPLRGNSSKKKTASKKKPSK